MNDITKFKYIACDAITAEANQLNEISLVLWNNPELLFEEHKAHELLTTYLEKKNFEVERSYILKTAFRAKKRFGNGPNVAVICEYDALPDIGHACGHNLIAEVGIGASIGVLAALEAASSQGMQLGQLTVLGTPAEEGGCGKGHLLEAGAFDDIDVAMMCHPAPLDSVYVDEMLAITQVQVRYKGRASHAGCYPWEGVNALDAAVMAYNSISVLRQQLKPEWRVHGVITNGGTKPNIIPEMSELQYYIRAQTKGDMQKLKDKIHACFESAASATGCEVDISWEKRQCTNVITNPTLASCYEKNLLSLPVIGDGLVKDKVPAGSTDMGNVSYVVPSIHPCFYIGTKATNHTRGFTDATGSEIAQPYTLRAAKTLAMTALDVYFNPSFVITAKKELHDALKLNN